MQIQVIINGVRDLTSNGKAFKIANGFERNGSLKQQIEFFQPKAPSPVFKLGDIVNVVVEEIHERYGALSVRGLLTLAPVPTSR